jgi:DNA-binding CsgD family transcriptional regulator
MMRLWIEPTGTQNSRPEFDRPDWGFRERDRTVLDLLLPHLRQLRRKAVGRSRPSSRADGLTPREGEVLALVAEGRTNAEVARVLWISPGTVRKHLENAYEKLGVHTRTGAVSVWGGLSAPDRAR